MIWLELFQVAEPGALTLVTLAVLCVLCAIGFFAGAIALALIGYRFPIEGGGIAMLCFLSLSMGLLWGAVHLLAKI